MRRFEAGGVWDCGGEDGGDEKVEVEEGLHVVRFGTVRFLSLWCWLPGDLSFFFLILDVYVLSKRREKRGREN